MSKVFFPEFFNSPKIFLIYEVGTFSQIKLFEEELNDYDENFYEEILIRIMQSQNLQEINSLSKIDNSILEENSSGISDFGSMNLWYYEKGHECMYSSIRNAIKLGMIDLLMKTYKG